MQNRFVQFTFTESRRIRRFHPLIISSSVQVHASDTSCYAGLANASRRCEILFSTSESVSNSPDKCTNELGNHRARTFLRVRASVSAVSALLPVTGTRACDDDRSDGVDEFSPLGRRRRQHTIPFKQLSRI